jgi:hypothetical protein
MTTSRPSPNLHSPDNELPVAIIGFPIPEPNTILRNDNRFGAPKPFELLHQLRQRAFRRAGAEHDQQFILDIDKELQNIKTDNARNQPKHNDDEECGGQVEHSDQPDQIAERGGPFAYANGWINSPSPANARLRRFLRAPLNG